MARARSYRIPPARVWIPKEDRQFFALNATRILESGRLTLGPYTQKFEAEFGAYYPGYDAVAMNSGTAALEAAIRALRPDKSTFLVPTNTFFATPAAVLRAGYRVRFLDMAESSLSVDPEDINENLDPDVAGLVVVHIGGIVTPGMREIREVCDDATIPLIEDCAHAHGSTVGAKLAGSFGDASAFSFFPTKVITCGEGGMLLLRNSEALRRARILRDQGKGSGARNLHVELGYNWRMSEIHALLGLTQLRRLSQFLDIRRRLARRYDKVLPGLKGLSAFRVPRNVESNYYKYICGLDDKYDRTEFKRRLLANHNVNLSGEVYEVPCHLQPVFRSLFHHSEGDFPVAEHFSSSHVCLPIFSNMTESEQDHVTGALRAEL